MHDVTQRGDGGRQTTACESWNFDMLFRVIRPPGSPRPRHASRSRTRTPLAALLLRHAIRLCKDFHKSCRSPVISWLHHAHAAALPAVQGLQRSPAKRTARPTLRPRCTQGRVSLCTN